MKFYAYIPRADGTEPVGGDKKLLFELKTTQGAHRRARRYLGPRYRLYRYTNFYDNKTFRQI